MPEVSPIPPLVLGTDVTLCLCCEDKEMSEFQGQNLVRESSVPQTKTVQRFPAVEECDVFPPVLYNCIL